MKNNSLKQMFVGLFTVLMIAGSVTAAAAANTKLVPSAGVPLIGRCGLRSLNGSYAMTVSATNLIPPSTTIQIAAVGVLSFDGEGRLTGTATTSFGGNVSTDPVTGAYTVEPNCTGTFSITFGNGFTINHNLVLADEGREMYFIQTDPGTITTGHAKRQ
jgi:hypothetical protein